MAIVNGISERKSGAPGVKNSGGCRKACGPVCRMKETTAMVSILVPRDNALARGIAQTS
jgi:hypothetical protein